MEKSFIFSFYVSVIYGAKIDIFQCQTTAVSLAKRKNSTLYNWKVFAVGFILTDEVLPALLVTLSKDPS